MSPPPATTLPFPPPPPKLPASVWSGQSFLALACGLVADGCTRRRWRRHFECPPPTWKTPALVVATRGAERQGGSGHSPASQLWCGTRDVQRVTASEDGEDTTTSGGAAGLSHWPRAAAKRPQPAALRRGTPTRPLACLYWLGRRVRGSTPLHSPASYSAPWRTRGRTRRRRKRRWKSSKRWRWRRSW